MDLIRIHRFSDAESLGIGCPFRGWIIDESFADLDLTMRPEKE